FLHRLPAPLGPAVDLGGHGRDLAGRLLAAGGHAGAVRAPRRHRGGAEYALTLVRAARAGLTLRAGDLPFCPLLADPQGRRHQRTTLGTRRPERWHATTPPWTSRPSTGSCRRSWTREPTAGWPRVGRAQPPYGPTGASTESPPPGRRRQSRP